MSDLNNIPPGLFDDDQAEYFEERDNDKQMRYDTRITREIARGLSLSTLSIKALESRVRDGATQATGFTPEWLSDELHCPILFRALRDYHLETGKDAFPAPTYLLSRQGRRGQQWAKIWDKLWLDTQKSFPDTYLAVCFRPKWAEHTVVLHNYDPILRHRDMGGWLMWYKWEEGSTIVQYLKDLILALKKDWEPSNVE